jgi:O-antigen/teichoic acid export membrane protein
MSDEKITRKTEKKTSLKANFVFNFISQILTLIVPVATTPYLSRILHETGNGQYSYALSIITIFIMFANLGFSSYGQREIARCQENQEERSKCFWEIVILRFISTMIVSSIFFAILFTTGFKKCNDLILILSIELVGSIFDIQFLFTGNEDFRSIALRTIIFKAVGLICVFCFVKTENDTWIYTLCMALSVVFSNLIMWPPAFKSINFCKLRILSFKKHIVPTLRIFAPTLAITIYAILDKAMLGLLVSPEKSDYENGCYEQAYKINGAALLLVTLISPVMISRNSSDFEKKDFDSIKRHVDYAEHYVWMIGIPLIAGFAALSANLCSWFLGDGFEEVPLLLQIMSVRFVFIGFSEIFGNQVFVASRKEIYFTIATTVTAIFDLLTNFIFVPWLGATGAAITTAVSELICCSILTGFAIHSKYVKLSNLLLMSWKYLLASAVMFVVIYLIQMYLPKAVWSFFVMVLIGIILYGLILFVLKDSFFKLFISKASNWLKRKILRK